jgi:hypothetical protein
VLHPSHLLFLDICTQRPYAPSSPQVIGPDGRRTPFR